MDEAEQVYQTAQAELAEADRAYSAIYGIRRTFFAPTHIGLGTWGRQEPLTPKAQESVRELQRTRARHLRRHRQLMARVAWDQDRRGYVLRG